MDGRVVDRPSRELDEEPRCPGELDGHKGRHHIIGSHYDAQESEQQQRQEGEPFSEEDIRQPGKGDVLKILCPPAAC